MLQTLASLLPDGLVWGHLAAMTAMVFAAAFLQGIGGVGFAMVSAPLSVLFFPELVPGPLLVLGAALAALGVLRDFPSIDWRSVAALMGGRAIGTFAAGALLLVLVGDAIAIVFALLILLGVALSLIGWKVRASVPNMIVAGLASGLMGTITSSGAPPFAIVMQHVPAARMRATISSVFVAGAILSLVTLTAVGRFNLAQLLLGLILAPAIILGFAASTPFNRLLSREAVRMILLGLSGLGALGILVRTLPFAG